MVLVKNIGNDQTGNTKQGYKRTRYRRTGDRPGSRKLSPVCALLGITMAAGIFCSGTVFAGETGFAVCEEYINVRSAASAQGDVIGKLYNNGKVEILETVEDEDGSWYHIQSGNVEGYVSADLIATGDEAEAIAPTAGYTTAQCGAWALNVHADASEDSETVGMLYEDAKYEVVDDRGDWIKVVTGDGTYGWVSCEYVYTSTEYGAAETLEEEQARLDQQWLAYLAEQDAQAAAAQEQENADAAQAAAWEAQAAADEAARAAEAAQAQAEADYQAYLQAQAAAEAAAEGTDSGEDTAAASQAQEAYETWEASQAAADEQQQQSWDAQANADDAQNTAEAAQTAADEAAASEQTAASEDASAAYSETSEASSSSGSSTGAAIASYACQFVGNPYVYGGTSLTGGADCSGFVMSVCANFGISLPHNAAAQSGCGTPVDASSLAPGDLVFYSDGSGISHVAIYIGNGSIVHAANSASGICYGNLNYNTPVAYRRVA